MREKLLLLGNVLLVVAISLVLIFIQITLWFHLFGWAPGPMLWLLPFIYVTLYRRSSEALFLLYLMALSCSVFTSKPLTIIITLMLILYFFVTAFKSRIYWEGFRYYAMMATSAALFYQLFDLGLSYVMEDYLFTEFYLFRRIFEVCLTGMFSLPIYRALLFADKITEKGRFSLPGSQAI